MEENVMRDKILLHCENFKLNQLRILRYDELCAYVDAGIRASGFEERIRKKSSFFAVKISFPIRACYN